MREFDLIFPSDGVLISRILARRSVDLVNRILRIGPTTFCIDFPQACLLDSCNGSPRSSSLVLPLLSVAGFSVYLLTSNTESCDEDDGEVGVGVVEEELADNPGTTNGTQLDILQSILLPFSDLMWFLTDGPVACIPMILAEFPERKNCGCRTLTNKSNCLTYTVAASLVCTAVDRHHRRRTSCFPHCLQLSRVKVFLTDQMHTRS